MNDDGGNVFWRTSSIKEAQQYTAARGLLITMFRCKLELSICSISLCWFFKPYYLYHMEFALYTGNAAPHV